ncbi:MAG TPA: ATP-binding protein [Bacillota bacterium]|nr:ATP-binding protein [Bacillota bacterium]
MKIAVLSGKGGTGKTLVSVNLAAVAKKSIYIDCDVEEPNGYLFFKSEIICEEDVTVKIPLVDDTLCNGCRKCVAFCKFNALAYVKNKPYLFETVCHSCGSCQLLCPEKAISEKEKVIGKVQEGVSGHVMVKTGILNPGEASGIPIIKKLLEKSSSDDGCPIFIDCPPGSACIVMESIKNADYCVLVAEPTLFGVHNLNMVYDLVRLSQKPYGVVLNKCLDGENPAETFCRERNIPILGSIPFDHELGTLNSNAKIGAVESERLKVLFSSLLHSVMKEARHETTVDSQR